MGDINEFLASLKAKGANSSSSSAHFSTAPTATTVPIKDPTSGFDFNLFLRGELTRVATLPLNRDDNDSSDNEGSDDDEYCRYLKIN